MRPLRGLPELSRVAERRLVRLQMAASTPPRAPEVEQLVAYCVLEAANLWSEYLRSLYLSIALGARDVSGVVIPIGLQRPLRVQDALTPAILGLRTNRSGPLPPWTHRDEPFWPAQITRAVQTLRIPRLTIARVGNALSIGSRAPTDLRTCRSHYAHKTESTAKKVLALGASYQIATPSRPSDILLAVQPGRPQNVLSDWLADLLIMTRQLASV